MKIGEMKIVELYGKHLERFLFMDPFRLSCVLDIPGSFALGSTMEQEDGTDRPAGIVIASEDTDRIVIDWIYVIPEYRGMGIGSRLMELVFDEADRRGRIEVTARISDAYDDEGHLWDADSFFVNDVFSDYEEMSPEIRFSMADISKRILKEEKLNKKAADDPTVVSLKDISNIDRQEVIRGMEKTFSPSLFAEAKLLLAPADNNMSLFIIRGSRLRGAMLMRKSSDTWYIYLLLGKAPEDIVKLIRAAMYYSEDYALPEDRICIQTQRQSGVDIIEKLGIDHVVYGIHYITASVSNYKKQKEKLELNS